MINPIKNLQEMFRNLERDPSLASLCRAATQELNDLLAMSWDRQVESHVFNHGLPEEVRWLLLKGKKIQAIKSMRGIFAFRQGDFKTSLGLKAAKDLVDQHGKNCSQVAEALRNKGFRIVDDGGIRIVDLDYIELHDLPRHSLNDMARTRNLIGYEFMNREELITTLRNHG